MYTVIDMTGAVKLSISPKFHKFIILYLYRHYRYRLTRVVPDKGPLNGCVCVVKNGKNMINSVPVDLKARKAAVSSTDDTNG